jgi:hypothetical protein
MLSNNFSYTKKADLFCKSAFFKIRISLISL